MHSTSNNGGKYEFGYSKSNILPNKHIFRTCCLFLVVVITPTNHWK